MVHEGKATRKFELERTGVLTRAEAMSADASIAGIFLSVYQHSGDSEWRQAVERDVEDSRLGEVTQTRYTYGYRFGFNGKELYFGRIDLQGHTPRIKRSSGVTCRRGRPRWTKWALQSASKCNSTFLAAGLSSTHLLLLSVRKFLG